MNKSRNRSVWSPSAFRSKWCNCSDGCLFPCSPDLDLDFIKNKTSSSPKWNWGSNFNLLRCDGMRSTCAPHCTHRFNNTFEELCLCLSRRYHVEKTFPMVPTVLLLACQHLISHFVNLSANGSLMQRFRLFQKTSCSEREKYAVWIEIIFGSHKFAGCRPPLRHHNKKVLIMNWNTFGSHPSQMDCRNSWQLPLWLSNSAIV